MIGILVLLGIALALIGASFLASLIFKGIWKTDITTGKLTFFLTTFLTSFLLISWILLLIISSGFQFAR